MNELQLLEDRSKRDEAMSVLNNVNVLDKVKEILTLGNSDFLTVQMASNYYEVGLEAINSLIKDNRKELECNGLITITGKETKEFLVKFSQDITNFKGYFKSGNHKFANRSNTLITKRCLLNIGMLLRDSIIAKELRSRILDIVYDANEDKGSITTISNEVEEEKQLKIDYVDAMMNGNILKMNEVNAKLFELKNKRITELEGKIETLSPLAEKFKIFMDIDGLTEISTFSKNLAIKGLGRNNMYKFLREKRFLMKDNMPYQIHVENKLFVVKPSGYHIENGVMVQDYKTFLTTKGVNKIIEKLQNSGLLK